jgi:lipoprotein-anchoring transpeptidase ErfK/SrfK
MVRASWLSVTLAAALGITMPIAASMAGTAVAAPIALTTSAAVSTRVLHPAGHDASTTRAPGRATRPERIAGSTPEHAGWDRASLLVHVPAGGVTARRNPWASAPAVGTVVASSKYYHVPIVLRVEATNRSETWGRVELPYAWPRVDGWIPLRGLQREQTFIHVEVDLSEHRVRVYKHDDLLYGVAGATGSWSSPTPPGVYVVTDRVPFSPGSALGSFAFGISGIQPHLPPGWSGGNQLAIHGTNDPSSIGTSASAGCVRVSEWALDRFKPLLRLGTPVIIHP